MARTFSFAPPEGHYNAWEYNPHEDTHRQQKEKHETTVKRTKSVIFFPFLAFFLFFKYAPLIRFIYRSPSRRDWAFNNHPFAYSFLHFMVAILVLIISSLCVIHAHFA